MGLQLQNTLYFVHVFSQVYVKSNQGTIKVKLGSHRSPWVLEWRILLGEEYMPLFSFFFWLLCLMWLGKVFYCFHQINFLTLFLVFL